MNVGKLWVELGLDRGDFDKGVSGVKGESKGLGDYVKNAFSFAIGQGMFDLLKTGMKSAWDMSMGFNSEMQQNKISFETMMGSADKAGKFLQWAQTFANQTPFEMADVVTGSKRLLAFGFSAEKIPEMLKAIGDASAGLGMSGSEGIGRVSTALGQMSAKGKVSAGEMMQLTEAGIPAWDMLAKGMGKSTAEVMSLSEKGLIPANQAIDVIVKGMESRFPNMMDKQSKSFAGLMSTLKDNVQVSLANVLKPQFENLANNVLPKLVDATSAFSDTFKNTGSVVQATASAVTNLFGKGAGDAVSSFGNAMAKGLGWIKDNGGTIKAVLSTIAGAFVAYKLAVLGSIAVQEIQNALTAISIIRSGSKAAADAFLTFTTGNCTAAQWLLNTAMEANPIGILIVAIGALVGAFIYLWKHNEGFRNFFIGAWGQIKDFFAGVWQNIKGVIDWAKGIWQSLVQIVMNVVSVIIGAWTGFVSAIGTVFSNIGTVIVGVWNNVISFFTTAFTFLGQIFTVGWMLIQSIVQGVMLFISSIIQAGWNIIVGIFQFYQNLISAIITFVWSYIGTYVMGALNAIANFFTTIWNAIYAGAMVVWNAIIAFFTQIFLILSTAWNTVWTGIYNVLMAIWGAISPYLIGAWTTISNFFIGAWNFYVNLFTQVFNTIKAVAIAVWTYLSVFFTNIWNGIVSVATTIWNTLANVVSTIWNGIKNVAIGVFNAVSSFISSIWQGIQNVTMSVWNTVSSGISAVWNGIRNVIASAINGVRDVVSSVWNTISSITSSVWNGIKNAIGTPIQGAVNIVKNAIDSIMGFFRGIRLPSFDLPRIKMPHFNIDGSFSLAPPSVPKLKVDWYKTGGIFSSPSVIGVGEAGSEAVIPLNKLSSIMADTLDKGGYAGGGQGNGGVYITVESMTVRKESDIDLIADKLYERIKRSNRGLGSK